MTESLLNSCSHDSSEQQPGKTEVKQNNSVQGLRPLFFALFWKEYRQQFPLALTMTACCFIVLWCMILMAWFSPDVYREDFSQRAIPVPFIFFYLYLLSSISTIFCREREEGTIHFLQSLPIPSGMVGASKMAWVMISSACLLGVLGLLTWGMVLIEGILNGSAWDTIMFSFDHHIPWPIRLFFMLAGAFVILACGLACSTIVRSQMKSFLLTCLCSWALFVLAMTTLFHLAHVFIGIPLHAMATRESLILLFLIPIVTILVTSPAWVIGGIRAWRFLDLVRKSPSGGQAPSTSTTPTENLLTEPVRSSFSLLIWQTVRQSSFVLRLGIVYGIIALFFAGLCFWENTAAEAFGGQNLLTIKEKLQDFLYPFLIMTGIPFIFVFCGTIFWKDQSNRSYRFLAIHGVSPRQVWWSRVLVFGTVYLGWGIVLLLFLFLTALRNGEFLALLSLTVKNIDITQYPLFGTTNGRENIFFFGRAMVIGYLSMFGLGLYFSMVFRSAIIPMFVTGIVGIVLWSWSVFAQIQLNLSAVSTALPIGLAFILASRLRVTDWLRERHDVRSHIKAFLPILVTMGAIYISLPLVRIYSIGKGDCFQNGLVQCSAILFPDQSIRKCREIVDANDQSIKELYKIYEVRSNQTNPPSIEEIRLNWEQIQQKMSSGHFPAHCQFTHAYYVEYLIYSNIGANLDHNEPSDDYKQKAIEFLESIPASRALLADVVRNHLTALAIDVRCNRIANDSAVNYHDYHDVPGLYQYAFPWEKQRMIRGLNLYLIKQMQLDRDFDLDREIANLYQRDQKLFTYQYRFATFSPPAISSDLIPISSFYDKAYLADLPGDYGRLNHIYEYRIYAEVLRRQLLNKFQEKRDEHALSQLNSI